MGENIQLDDWFLEKEEWLEALEEVIEAHGKVRAEELFQNIRYRLARKGIANGGPALNTPYLNTIPAEDQPPYPGDLETERRLENIIRWNAQAMVLQAQDKNLALGGHIATYAASATVLEMLFNHFLRNRSADYGGDLLMLQGHASPGIYARAVMEGRMPVSAIADFRQETLGGVASYPHPRRMPEFWQAPTVSMGLGPMTAVYQARFIKYLEDRGLKPRNGGRVWHIIGDGEIDEPEVYGTIGTAARENLDNLVFVVHCNLQRLDGPVRGNGKIIQEVERHFFGAGWEVIKVLWSSDWDELLARDVDGALLRRLEMLVDGDFQEMSAMQNGALIRQKLTGDDPRVAQLLSTYTDDQLLAMRRGGHDHLKVFAAFDRAVRSDKPVAILVHTVKGYGMGKAAEGKNKAHQTKDISDDARLETRDRYGIPLSDEQAKNAEFWYPAANDPVVQYMHERRRALGGYLPEREERHEPFAVPELSLLDKQLKGSEALGGKEVSTTAAMIDIMTTLIRNSPVGKYIVPIVPDEAQTFGMEAMFNSAQIWNQKGQLYTPLEIGISVIKYKESKTGQVLQEGINEDGALASFTAAGTAYTLHGVPTVPFYIYYSMFGFQRVGDMVWAATDMLAKGFLLGATAGRTTLNGEGLQHEDGHSLMLAQTMPGVVSYDPAFAFELAVIVQDGLRRMYAENEHKIYYLTIYNENYYMPTMPANAEEGIKRGLYRYKTSERKASKGVKAHLFGAGSIMQQVLKAAELLESEGISTDVWSATSWVELYRDGVATQRWNLLHPGEPERQCWLEQQLLKEEGVFVSANDWMRVVAGQCAPWMPKDFIALGTDGYGLSDSRENLRDYFEISPRYIAFAAVRLLQRQGKVTEKAVKDFMAKYGVDGEKMDPMTV
ncbi:MAG: pyruvate dehydrogenase (acetyl-transferring), homodimeric type [Saprospiraceae bacterium]|nr:pyruvate dehydrogenase (acetyl-transferring), homodimeric type [Saprospiraceae bacterium]